MQVHKTRVSNFHIVFQTLGLLVGLIRVCAMPLLCVLFVTQVNIIRSSHYETYIPRAFISKEYISVWVLFMMKPLI